MIASTQSNHPFAAGTANSGSANELLDALTERVHAAGGRITKPRIAMLKALAARRHPITIDQLHADIGTGVCDLVTLYRSMAAFEELGVVKRSFFHNGTVLYELTLNQPPRYHVVCKATNRVDPISADITEELQRALESVQQKLREAGYAAVNHRVEFFGIGPVVASSAGES